MNNDTKDEKKETTSAEPSKMVNEVHEVYKFTKEQFLGSDKYADKRDVLSVVLEDDKEYTFFETDKKIDDFLKKGVK